jgi:hypothetical protein
MAGIFISYRRDSSRHASGRLADDLAQAFGSASIFRDIEGIEPGVDFTRSLEKALRSCAVMLVVIGPQWLDASNAHGRRRLEQEDDWVRLEIETALARDIRVIPILLEGTTLPPAEALPAALQPLRKRQAIELADVRWRGDVERLVQTLAKMPGIHRVASAEPAPATRGSKARQIWFGAALGVGTLILIAGLFGEDEEAYVPDDQQTEGSIQRLRVPAPPDPRHDLAAVAPPADRSPRGATPSATVPDLSGMWRTLTGESYIFEQQGRNVRFEAEAGGESIGSGRGQLDGDTLRLTMTLRVQGVVLGSANCDLQPSPDRSTWAGMCMGPNGAFMAQMFR